MRRYDLNLLVGLDALLRERSVSGAARRLGIGQPAMSATLARLRAQFGDPLLVRTPRGMEPTPRARALAEPLRAALGALGQLVEPAAPFDRAAVRRTFRLSGGDYVSMTVLPGLLARFGAEAPGVDLRFRFVEKDATLDCLDRGELDLALLVPGELPARFAAEPLLTETFVCAVRRGHPALAAPLEVEAFAALDHLLVTERGDDSGCVDHALAERGLARRVAATVPSAALVAEILKASDLVATVPRRAAERMAAEGGVVLFEPPLATPSWTMAAVWTVREAHDPGLVWLRALLREVATTEMTART